MAAHAVRLTADLQRSRERLVTAREEERRRLRRDLHDGLGPQLASLTLRAGTAPAIAGRTTRQPQALLAELHASRLKRRVADIRRLVYELRPPALDELGLVGALRAGGRPVRSTGLNGLRVQVERAREPAAAAGGGRGRRLSHRAGGADQRRPPRQAHASAWSGWRCARRL